jgi:hypothetical protein
VDAPATSDAGPDQSADLADVVTLDATGSTDPDGDPLLYSWVQTAGSAVTLVGANTAQPSFIAPAPPTVVRFQLTVDDQNGRTDTDTMDVLIGVSPPTADAGPDQTVNLGDTVTLDGTGSTDPEGDTLTFAWEQTGGGTVVSLTGANTAQPTFTSPEGPDVLVFTLTASDGYFSDTDTVSIEVNGPPTADAGPDASVSSADAVTLDGTGSTDPDGDPLSYSWVQTAGFPVTLVAASTSEPSFIAPASATVLTFQLTVDDQAGRTDIDTVDITVDDGNGAPTADAGTSTVVETGDEVTLDGTGSSDPDEDELDYAWSQTAGRPVTLTSATTAEPTFTAPMSRTSLVFELEVCDPSSACNTDEVVVFVRNPPPPPPTCQGAPVTVDLARGQEPTGGRDVIWGTAGDDVINGLGGNDVVCGRAGDDVIRGGRGDDRIFGARGGDLLVGGFGRDSFVGGYGFDSCRGGAGSDTARGCEARSSVP